MRNRVERLRPDLLAGHPASAADGAPGLAGSVHYSLKAKPLCDSAPHRRRAEPSRFSITGISFPKFFSKRPGQASDDVLGLTVSKATRSTTALMDVVWPYRADPRNDPEHSHYDPAFN